MEVINESKSMLSNFEVLSLLTDIQTGKGQRKPNKHQQNLATITYEAVKYLEGTPCKLQDAESIQKFMDAIKPFKLTRAEKLQLLNHRPSTAVEIQIMIEESEERLTEDQIYELLDLLAKYLPSDKEEEMEQDEEDGDGEMEEEEES
ncbi:DNA-directed RNA polymerase III subunit RPC9-like [Haliotis asinina]|uniref:DNA-directed RNA polymerase III subunit RPC9-like n=1 Tax=Haliotis asinina TaxID=109174 RepID=UPI003531E007